MRSGLLSVSCMSYQNLFSDMKFLFAKLFCWFVNHFRETAVDMAFVIADVNEKDKKFSDVSLCYRDGEFVIRQTNWF